MVFEKVTQLIADHIDCDVSEIKEDTKFEDLGIDSLEIAEIVMKIEDEFAIELEMDGSLKQVSDLVAVIEEKTQS
mgnify:FL=1